MVHKRTFDITLFFIQLNFIGIHYVLDTLLVGIQGELDHVRNVSVSFLPYFFFFYLTVYFWLSYMELVLCLRLQWYVFRGLYIFLSSIHSITSDIILSSEAAVRVNELIHKSTYLKCQCSIYFSYCYQSIPCRLGLVLLGGRLLLRSLLNKKIPCCLWGIQERSEQR